MSQPIVKLSKVSLRALDRLLCDRTKHISTLTEVFKMHNNTFSKDEGDALCLLNCKEVIENLVSSTHGIMDLKLDKEIYVDPNTRLWEATTSLRSCREHFPTAFKTQTGGVTAEPQLKAAAAPDYKPLLETRNGVLSPELLDRATNLYTEDTQYLLQNLVPKVMEAMTPWTRFTKWIDDSAAYIGRTRLLSEGFRTLTYSISFISPRSSPSCLRLLNSVFPSLGS